MKKTIITMLIALVAIVTSAEAYNYLKFTKTNGTTATYSVEGLNLTYDDSNVYVTNAETSATIALSDVQDMYFSNEAGSTTTAERGDVNGDGKIDVADVALLIDYVLGKTSDIIVEAANCDLQSNIDVADVSALINRVLNGTW